MPTKAPVTKKKAHDPRSLLLDTHALLVAVSKKELTVATEQNISAALVLPASRLVLL